MQQLIFLALVAFSIVGAKADVVVFTLTESAVLSVQDREVKATLKGFYILDPDTQVLKGIASFSFTTNKFYIVHDLSQVRLSRVTLKKQSQTLLFQTRFEETEEGTGQGADYARGINANLQITPARSVSLPSRWKGVRRLAMLGEEAVVLESSYSLSFNKAETTKANNLGETAVQTFERMKAALEAKGFQNVLD